MPTSWSEGEKLDVLFQIIALGGPIPWKEIRLPEGRTMKAAQQMIDKEKKKAITFKDGGSTDVTPAPSPAKGKKRSTKAAELGDGDVATPGKKTKKSGKKTTVTAAADEEDGSSPKEESENEDEKFKPEAAHESDEDEV